MRLLNAASILVFVAVALGVMARMAVIKIRPGHVGVVNQEWTGGFVEQDFGPGYHLDLGPFHTWTVFDTTVQTLHMKRLQPGEEGTAPLQVKSADGATVTMDVSIKYRIRDGSVWRVMKQQGPGQTLASGYKAKVRDRALDVLVKSLGSLNTEDFYRPDKRAALNETMEKSLEAELSNLHVDLIAILIRDLHFQESFEANIKKKALAEEEIRLNQAQELAEAAKGRTRKITEETIGKVGVIQQEKEKELATMKAENDRKIAAIRADFEKKVTEVKSDADLYAAGKEAEGIRLLKEAEADGQKLKREALAAAGGRVYVALELVRNLELGDMLVSTQLIDPLDIDAMMRRLGAR